MNMKIDVHAKVSDLNIGQRQMTEIMKALAGNAKLIVMDEPSSTLSKREFETLIRLIKDLKEKGITLIYISHHLEELLLWGTGSRFSGTESLWHVVKRKRSMKMIL